MAELHVSPKLAFDPAVDQRMTALASELRCLVCQNQSIAQSQSPLAHDLRQQIRELMDKGQSDEQIRQYMTDRYGRFILYRPRMEPATWPLWFGPGLLAAGGLSALLWTLRRRSRMQAQAFDPDDSPEHEHDH